MYEFFMMPSRNHQNSNTASEAVSHSHTPRSILFLVAILFLQIFLSPIISGHHHSTRSSEIGFVKKTQIKSSHDAKESKSNDENLPSNTDGVKLDVQGTHNPENHSHGFFFIILARLLFSHAGKLPLFARVYLLSNHPPKIRPFKPPKKLLFLKLNQQD